MKKSKKLVSVLLAMFMILSFNCMTSFAATAVSPVNMVNKSNLNASPRIAQYVWVDTDVLNYRSGPGTEYSVLGQVKRDQRLWITDAEYDSNGVDWYKCTAIGGWVCCNYVRFEE